VVALEKKSFWKVLTVTLDRELCGNVRLKTVQDRAVGHITVVELELV
jgi:hypothetical protein